tara:strand:+ start:2704 stop:3315 length:612 start_codon:yes stop_codon:yes gene_type:complete
MIKKRIGKNLGARIAIMQVVDYYVQNQTVICDLMDSRATIYRACSFLKLGGLETFIHAPIEKGTEVLTVTSQESTPYIIGQIDSKEIFTDLQNTSVSGEYSSSATGKDDILLKRGSSKIVLSDKIYQTSTRIQEKLEVSDGNQPLNSATLSEPLLAYITELNTAITSLNASVQALATASGVEVEPVIAPLVPSISSDLVKIER